MPNERRAARAAQAELYLGHENFVRLTAQINQAYVKLDDTLAHTLRMSADFIETAQSIGLEPEQGQKLFRKLTTHAQTVLGSRDELIAAHLESTRIRMRTDQAERADGCLPPPWGQEEEKLRIVA